MKRYTVLFLLFTFISISRIYPLDEKTISISGRVIDKDTRDGVGYATVFIVANKQWYAVADSLGYFKIRNILPGIYSLSAVCQGYATTISPEYIISPNTPFIEIELKQSADSLDGITVISSTLERSRDAGVGEQVIGIGDIEKIAGGNRDISRVVRSYPGVAFSPIGYRNDLIVRGGSPSENIFYIDGIEIPNINHFATQGASGGPVGIINADLIEQVKFYTGAFPVELSGALSSIMNVKLKDGNFYNNNFKATLGASEFAFSGGGHLGDKTTYLFSIRRSYLQYLFKLLKLPFLPDYIDSQIKIKHRITTKDEIIVLALAGIDDMELNTEEEGENVEYLLSYLPEIKQQTYTVGSIYSHYGERNVLSVSASYSNLYNKNIKYMDNDHSTDENLILNLRSTEQKAIIRVEDRVTLGQWDLLFGIKGSYTKYWSNSLQKSYIKDAQTNVYTTKLPIFGGAVFFSGNYLSDNKRFTTKMGIRFDYCDYSKKMKQIWRTFSPRIQVGYLMTENLSLSANAGVYHQLPSLTSLGYKFNDDYINQELSYMRVIEMSAGIKWSKGYENQTRVIISLEGFYKSYGDMPLSVNDGIPLACKGNDYGVIGNEVLVSKSKGKSYGVEITARCQKPGKVNFMTTVTIFKSEYDKISSSWDNRFITNTVVTYNFDKGWSVGAKFSCIGGAPYTPYDIEKSSLKLLWDIQGKGYPDYSLYNEKRLKTFYQLDIRADKSFYFRKWMLGLYIDIQNITGKKLKQEDALMSTGVIKNPEAPVESQQYLMKTIAQEAGSIVPTIGLTVEF